MCILGYVPALSYCLTKTHGWVASHSTRHNSFGMDMSNFVVSDNATFCNIRMLQPPGWLERICMYLAVEHFECHASNEKWYAIKTIIALPVVEWYQSQARKVGACCISWWGQHHCMEERNGSDMFAHQHQVGMDLCTCSCLEWQQLGFLCHRAFAFAMSMDNNAMMQAPERFC